MFDLTAYHSWRTTVIPSDCDDEGELRYSRQLKMQENIGTDQFDQCGLSIEKMVENGFAFVIANAVSRYYRLPRSGEEIRLTTMHIRKKGIHFYRSYTFESSGGEPLIEAYNDFILVDPINHKLLSPEVFDRVCRYNENEPKISLEFPKRVRLPHDMANVGNILIERKDIDFNHHLNNSVYWDYIRRFLPCSADEVGQIRISYLSEGFLGENMKIFRKEEGNQIFLSGEHERGLSFAAEITKKPE